MRVLLCVAVMMVSLTQIPRVLAKSGNESEEKHPNISDLIFNVRCELINAQIKAAEGGNEDLPPIFEGETFSMELYMGVTKSKGTKGGFRFFVFEFGADKKQTVQAGHRLQLTFKMPEVMISRGGSALIDLTALKRSYKSCETRKLDDVGKQQHKKKQ